MTVKKSGFKIVTFIVEIVTFKVVLVNFTDKPLCYSILLLFIISM